MGQSDAIVLTTKLVNDFYNFGNMTNILSLLDCSVVGFGSQSMEYAVGVAAVKALLSEEQKRIMPCKIAKSHYREGTSSKAACTVMANVMLRTVSTSALLLHCLLVMYQQTENGLKIVGIHITRDIHHESTYRMISSGMMNKGMEHKLESKIMDVVTSYVDCAYVIYQLNAQRAMQFFSDEFWRMMGYGSEAEFLQVSKNMLFCVVYEPDRKKIQNELTRQLLRKSVYQMEYRMMKKDGSLIWVMECGRRITDDDGRYTFNSIITDITPLKKTRENLIYRVSYDDLTGIYNKAAFYQKAQELIHANPQETFEILRVNVERFKVINDLFGEEMGDRLLKYIARFFEQIKIPRCVYGRVHSDNFVLCFPVGNDNRQKLIAEMQAKLAGFSLDYKIILCFGVYRVMEKNLPVSVMCDRANLALNKAKGNYLMVCGEYDEKMRQSIVLEQAIINEMNDALINEEFVLYLQPKYDLITEKIVGSEALVRWNHPGRGLVSPAEFIPIFERNGFILKLDQYVWESACKLIRKWLDEGINPLPISVNVSRIDLYSANLCGILTELIKKYDIPSSLLELELTESAYTENPQQIIKITKKLQDAGFVILMDDFGSGYSSLNMLKDVSVDILKIDLHFLDNNDESGRGGNILNSIVRMAKWLKMPVIAEGVETQQQVEFLRTIGCTRVQGYYYSRPIPVDDYELLSEKEEAVPRIKEILLDTSDTSDTEDIWNPNAQFNLLFNSINGGIGLYELSSSGLEALRVNDGYLDMFGYDKESFYARGRQVMDYIHEADRVAFMDMLQCSLTREKAAGAQCRIRRCCDNGRTMWLHVRASAIVTEKDRQLFYLAMEDITELQDKTMELETLFDNIPAGFGVYELRDGTLWAHFLSRGIYELNDMTKEEFMQATGGDLGQLLDAETMRLLIRAVECSYIEKKTKQIQYLYTTRTGESYQVLAAFNTIKGEADHLLCYAFLRKLSDCAVEKADKNE